MQSEKINELAGALAKAQGAFPDIPKTKTAIIKSSKGDYEYKYADLADIIKATRPALVANELAVTQRISNGPAGEGAILNTMLLHSSGQFLSDELQFFPSERMQETGSTITYLRRYSFSGLIGVASDDDEDGQGSNAQKKAAPARTSNSAPKTPHQGNPPVKNSAAPDLITPAQITRLWAIAGEKHWSDQDVHASILRGLKLKSVKDMPKAHYEAFCEFMTNNPKAPPVVKTPDYDEHGNTPADYDAGAPDPTDEIPF